MWISIRNANLCCDALFRCLVDLFSLSSVAFVDHCSECRKCLDWQKLSAYQELLFVNVFESPKKGNAKLRNLALRWCLDLSWRPLGGKSGVLHCLPSFTHRLSPIAYCVSPIAYGLSPIACHRSLPISYLVSPFACACRRSPLASRLLASCRSPLASRLSPICDRLSSPITHRLFASCPPTIS